MVDTFIVIIHYIHPRDIFEPEAAMGALTGTAYAEKEISLPFVSRHGSMEQKGAFLRSGEGIENHEARIDLHSGNPGSHPLPRVIIPGRGIVAHYKNSGAHPFGREKLVYGLIAASVSIIDWGHLIDRDNPLRSFYLIIKPFRKGSMDSQMGNMGPGERIPAHLKGSILEEIQRMAESRFLNFREGLPELTGHSLLSHGLFIIPKLGDLVCRNGDYSDILPRLQAGNKDLLLFGEFLKRPRPFEGNLEGKTANHVNP